MTKIQSLWRSPVILDVKATRGQSYTDRPMFYCHRGCDPPVSTTSEHWAARFIRGRNRKGADDDRVVDLIGQINSGALL